MISWGRIGRAGWRQRWWVAVLAFVSVGLVVGSAAAIAQKRARTPDLVVRSLSKPPASVAGGATFRSTVSIANVGRRAARRSPVRFLGASPAFAEKGGSYTRVYLSRNARKDSGDVALSPAWLVPALQAGKVARHTWLVRVPTATATGLWFVIACADATHLV